MSNLPALHCRFYENVFPCKDEVVNVTVCSIQNMGAYVKLLEYDNREGMILMSELSRRRIRSINKLIRVGRDEIVVVIRVDEQKGYIDLSKRQVSSAEAQRCELKYGRAKTVNQILRNTAFILKYETNEQLEDLYRKTAWHFDRKFNENGAAYEAFKSIMQNRSMLDECDIGDEVKEALYNEICRRLMPQAVKIRADFELSCFAYEGIDAIRRALVAGMRHSTEEMAVKIHLIAPPTFFITVTTTERKEGCELINRCLQSIEECIKSENGKFNLVSPVQVVSDTEEELLKRKMQELEAANREVSGDDDSSEEAGSNESGNDDSDDEGVAESTTA